jgi:hypothetical protein
VREQLRQKAKVIKVGASGGGLSEVLANLEQLPACAAARLCALADAHALAVSLAMESDVTIAMGTGIGLTGMDRPNSWGNSGSELVHLVSLGMTVRAIEAATATAPLTLGPQAPQCAAGPFSPWPSGKVRSSAGRERADPRIARRRLPVVCNAR